MITPPPDEFEGGGGEKRGIYPPPKKKKKLGRPCLTTWGFDKILRKQQLDSTKCVIQKQIPYVTKLRHPDKGRAVIGSLSVIVGMNIVLKPANKTMYD